MLRKIGSKIFYQTLKILKQFNKDSLLFSSERCMDHILDNLYVGDLRAADDKKLLQENGITHIINCSDNAPIVFPNDFVYSHLKLKDDFEQDLEEEIKIAIKFISSVPNNSAQNILIHCIKGASRSGSIMIAYLILIKKMSYEEALQFAISKRKVIKPNKNFEVQLKKLIIN